MIIPRKSRPDTYNMNNDITLQEGVDFLRDAGKKLFTMGFDEDKPEKPEIEIYKDRDA